MLVEFKGTMLSDICCEMENDTFSATAIEEMITGSDISPVDLLAVEYVVIYWKAFKSLLLEELKSEAERVQLEFQAEDEDLIFVQI